jgi:hypothetical protein
MEDEDDTPADDDEAGEGGVPTGDAALIAQGK